jgi:hypothetical protein
MDPPPSSVEDPENRPTEGGMVEGDAAVIADLNGWWLDTKKYTCSDKSHAPKGKVYTDGTSFYGADNTGHVGWGFKVWTRKKGNELQYEGNLVWDGTTWKHIPRGT